MAAGPVEDAGVETACPKCSKQVKQHSMIPVLEAGDTRHICVECARALIPPEALEAPQPTAS